MGRRRLHGTRFAEADSVQCFTLDDILGAFDRVGLIHMDIQGVEGTVIKRGADTLTRSVRRMVIETHEREIEGDIIRTLEPHGWVFEAGMPAGFYYPNGKRALLDDGCHAWADPWLSQ